MRKRIFEIIQPDRGNSLASRIFDWSITMLILASVVIVFAVTFDLPDDVLRVLMRVEEVASIVFTVEYLLRILTADMLIPARAQLPRVSSMFFRRWRSSILWRFSRFGFRCSYRVRCSRCGRFDLSAFCAF